MGVNVDKGWMSVPGIREHSDRTLETQMGGLERALAEAKGKTVLDLGCAEGLIGREFARAGAIKVVGLEILETHLAIARQACADELAAGKMEFVCSHLLAWVHGHPDPDQYDIVLALGVIHKLNPMRPALEWAARSCRDLLCFRSARRTEDPKADYEVQNKRKTDVMNPPQILRAAGFVDDGKAESSLKEITHYWRRAR